MSNQLNKFTSSKNFGNNFTGVLYCTSSTYSTTVDLRCCSIIHTCIILYSMIQYTIRSVFTEPTMSAVVRWHGSTRVQNRVQCTEKAIHSNKVETIRLWVWDAIQKKWKQRLFKANCLKRHNLPSFQRFENLRKSTFIDTVHQIKVPCFTISFSGGCNSLGTGIVLGLIVRTF